MLALGIPRGYDPGLWWEFVSASPLGRGRLDGRHHARSPRP